MKRTMLAGLAGVSCLALMTAAAPARAIMIAAAPIPERVANAELIVVGKVTGYGPKMVKVGAQEYQIALVKVEDTVLGKAGKEVKVGFVPLKGGAVGGPVRPPRFATANLTVGQEVCLFLAKHPKEDFYTVRNYFDVLDKKSPTFAKELEEVKRCAKLLAKPKAGLESKDKDDRFLTAAMLVARYRTPKGDAPKLAPIDAAESKQILLALADADWAPKARGFTMTPQAVFYRLGLGPKDGWTPPKNFKDFPDEAKKWLKANAGKYRIQGYVAAAPVKPDVKKD